MKDVFLRVYKDLFYLNLKPIELLILAQIIEWDTNTKECYETNESFAKKFHVGVATITRAISALEEKNLIKTKMIKGTYGKNRLIKLNRDTLEIKIAREGSNQND